MYMGDFFIEYIYKLENKINGKCYIGKSKKPNKRLIQHKRLVGKKRHKLYDAINHYGWDNFEFSIIDETESKNINELEIHYIKKLDTINNGYNYTKGGTGGDTFTNKSEQEKEITRKKLSIPSSEKTKKLLSEMSKNLWLNDEYRTKVLTKQKKFMNTDEYKEKVSKGLKTKLQNPEMREIWSKAKKGKKNGNWLGYIVMYNKEGIEVKRYESSMEASNDLGIPSHTIRTKARNGEPYKCLKNGDKYYGFKFKFVK